jgi:hypothetical protein
MIAMTTSSSINVNARRLEEEDMKTSGRKEWMRNKEHGKRADGRIASAIVSSSIDCVAEFVRIQASAGETSILTNSATRASLSRLNNRSISLTMGPSLSSSRGASHDESITP